MKKKTNREIVVDRVYRRLQTLKSKGIALTIEPTKKNIRELIRGNQAEGHLPSRITKNNRNQIVEEIMNPKAPQGEGIYVTSHDQAKRARKYLGLRKTSDVQKLTGMDLHNEIAGLYDQGMDDDAEGLLEAYGYEH